MDFLTKGEKESLQKNYYTHGECLMVKMKEIIRKVLKRTSRTTRQIMFMGTKEIWYMHSIESKTMVALFKMSDREDGLGVIDENGGKNLSAKLKNWIKLNCIQRVI